MKTSSYQLLRKLQSCVHIPEKWFFIVIVHLDFKLEKRIVRNCIILMPIVKGKSHLNMWSHFSLLTHRSYGGVTVFSSGSNTNLLKSLRPVLMLYRPRVNLFGLSHRASIFCLMILTQSADHSTPGTPGEPSHISILEEKNVDFCFSICLSWHLFFVHLIFWELIFFGINTF